jgi:hypothetical protein
MLPRWAVVTGALEANTAPAEALPSSKVVRVAAASGLDDLNRSHGAGDRSPMLRSIGTAGQGDVLAGTRMCILSNRGCADFCGAAVRWHPESAVGQDL